MEQIDSILPQLHIKDELVISVDPSSDNTLEIVRDYEKNDPRVKVVENKDHSKGLVSNFEYGLKQCKNEIIFYSDQDDIWIENKIDQICHVFDDPQVTVAFHDAKLVDENLKVTAPSTFALRGGARTTVLGNLVRLSYIGCCMAFRSKYLSVILPLATTGRSHDWWTGCICGCYGRMVAIKEPLVLHRMHGNNATVTIGNEFRYRLRTRIVIAKELIVRRYCSPDCLT